MLCNPFSVNRKGLNIGEGACVFLITRTPGPVRLYGIGESSDGYHMSRPIPKAAGPAAIRAVLAQAALVADGVGYVNLPGTATPKNDEMESRVGGRVFGIGDAVRLDEVSDRAHARRGRRAGTRPVLVTPECGERVCACRRISGTASRILSCRRSTWSAATNAGSTMCSFDSSRSAAASTAVAIGSA